MSAGLQLPYAREKKSVCVPNSPLFDDDWYLQINGASQDHVDFFIATNWAGTPLGPLASWDAILRIQTFAVLSDTQPGCLYWGPQRVAIYNAAFVPMSGKAHPRLMGQPFSIGFPEIWPHIKPMFDTAEKSGIATDVLEHLLVVERNNFVEEAYFTGTFNPIRGFSGTCEGFRNSVHEVTQQRISNRRSQMFNEMSISLGSDDATLGSLVMAPLEKQNEDITMALLYEIDEDDSSESKVFYLRGSLGIPEGHPLGVSKASFNSDEGLIPRFREAGNENYNISVDSQFDGVQWRGFKEGDSLVRSEIVTIIPLEERGRLLGFLAVGANPRRPIDKAHERFMTDLRSKVYSIAVSLHTNEEAKKRAEGLKKKVERTEQRISHMAHNATMGMLVCLVDGEVDWANHHYYKMTEQAPLTLHQDRRLRFVDPILEEDREAALREWDSLLRNQETLLRNQEKVSIQLRLQKMFVPPIGEPEPACVDATLVPFHEEGAGLQVMIFMHDISAFRWAERTEKRNANDAREAKKQQEEFIDIVSHEIRNPLSAILMSADAISNSIAEVKSQSINEDRLLSVIAHNVEAANTIIACANFQKRIVDDVLTLSKLEYEMLAIKPEAIQLEHLVDTTLKMFENQLEKKDIRANAFTESSNKSTEADWVSCDPSRLTQIIVNFLSNAIKFTELQENREISVRYAAVTSEPRTAFPESVNWAPVGPKSPGEYLIYERDPGQILYLTFAVQDTGIGMTPDQTHELFQRFRQANIKTSIKYGGSGLGLFICKKLTEKMGGEIGVISEAGKGSTFIFYVEANRTLPQPKVPEETEQFPFPPIRSTSSPAPDQFAVVSDLSHMHVLLVEDNLVNQKILSQQLKRAGCIVTVANQGFEALDRLEESLIWRGNVAGKRLDIILMDWEMPEMDGLTCARKIRELEGTGQLVRRLQIIGTTANARDEQLKMALESGMDSVISKPFLVSDLLEQMRERLSKVDDRVEASRSITS